MKNGTCPKCENTVILQGVRVVDETASDSRELTVAVYRWPEKQGGEVRGKLWACVCAVCGYTELYATNLNELAKAAMAAQTEA
jgi:predicted nucleic-acid-binding Zn-ribbon protein